MAERVFPTQRAASIHAIFTAIAQTAESYNRLINAESNGKYCEEHHFHLLDERGRSSLSVAFSEAIFELSFAANWTSIEAESELNKFTARQKRPTLLKAKKKRSAPVHVESGTPQLSGGSVGR